MTAATEQFRTHKTPTDAAALASLREQIADLEGQLTELTRHQQALRTALDDLRARLPKGEPHSDPALGHCARDVVRLLRGAGRPLTALELLEEMATHRLNWREGTVRHVLADLTAEGVLREGHGLRPRSYLLAGGVSAAPASRRTP